MFIKFIELYILPLKDKESKQKYSLREVVINDKYIVEVKENIVTETLLKTEMSQFPIGMNEEQKFTTFTMNDKRIITVVGDLNSILQKINLKNEKILLKG